MTYCVNSVSPVGWLFKYFLQRSNAHNKCYSAWGVCEDGGPLGSSTFHLPASSFQLPTSTFHLPPSSFQLPPSAFHLPAASLCFLPPTTIHGSRCACALYYSSSTMSERSALSPSIATSGRHWRVDKAVLSCRAQVQDHLTVSFYRSWHSNILVDIKVITQAARPSSTLSVHCKAFSNGLWIGSCK